MKKYFEVWGKYPPDESLEKQVVPVATTTSNCGYETISVTEVERKKVGDAFERQKSAFIEFQKIEGFNKRAKKDVDS